MADGMTKIQIAIAPEQDYLDGSEADLAMTQTIRALLQAGVIPFRKISLVVEVANEDAEGHEETIEDALIARPSGIVVTMKSTRERSIGVEKKSLSTPMFGGGVDSVTLSSANQSVTLTAEAARKAMNLLKVAAE